MMVLASKDHFLPQKMEPCVRLVMLASGFAGSDVLYLFTKMEPCVGSAPTTCRLQGGCSTN